MGLYRRGKIYWFTTMQDGKRIQISTKTDNKRLAEAIYAKAKTEVIEGRWFEKHKQSKREYTFMELAEKYESWMQGRYRSDFKVHIIRQLKERFKNHALRQLDVSELEKLQTERLMNGKKKIKVGDEWRTIPNKPATANRFIAVIAHMFTKAADWKMIDRTEIPKIKMLKENNRRLRYLSKEECQALINACDSHLKPIVITALNTGMRKGEILNLKWDNVDLKHGFICLNQSQTKNAERKEIPINGTLRAVFQAITRRLDIPYVFYNPATSSPYQKDLKKSFATALKKAGITDFHFHDLRHTFASQLVMAGVDITTVKELLGHKTLTMTLRYSHLAPSHKVKAMEIYDQKVNYYNFATVADGHERAAI